MDPCWQQGMAYFYAAQAAGASRYYDDAEMYLREILNEYQYTELGMRAIDMLSIIEEAENE